MLNSIQSRHAGIRAQQRCIPPFADELLDRFGRRQYTGHGAEIVFFDHGSKRAMARELGSRPVAKLVEFFDVFKVVDSATGRTVTTGHRTQRIWRT